MSENMQYLGPYIKILPKSMIVSNGDISSQRCIQCNKEINTNFCPDCGGKSITKNECIEFDIADYYFEGEGDLDMFRMADEFIKNIIIANDADDQLQVDDDADVIDLLNFNLNLDQWYVRNKNWKRLIDCLTRDGIMFTKHIGIVNYTN